MPIFTSFALLFTFNLHFLCYSRAGGKPFRWVPSSRIEVDPRPHPVIPQPRRAELNGGVKFVMIGGSRSSTAIGEFQANHLKAKDPDKRVDAGGKTFLTLRQYYRAIFKSVAITAPTYGEVTWESEGAEGGPYHSRCFHVPSNASGLTIGRGYDMKEKTQKKISEDIVAAGLTQTQADTIKKSAGLNGVTARFFVVENDLLDFQLTPGQQLALFKISYDEQAKEVKRICELPDSVKRYGKVDWDNLNSAIKDITVDLKFRGDYTPNSRKNIQKSIADNDLDEFKKQLKDSTNWPSVPKDRFDRRVKFLDKN